MIAMAACVLFSCGSCGNGGYYEEKSENPLANRDVGGSDTLTLIESGGEITLENGKVRIILRSGNGAIKELCNKQSKIYLTQEGEGPAVRINRIENGREMADANHQSFSYSVAENSAERKAVNLHWTFGNIKISSVVSLTADADEVVFRLSAEGNELVMKDGLPVSGLYNIEYPIINRIDTLYKKDTDAFLSPFVTGYLFRDPVDNFNGAFSGISKSFGLYPSGWEYPMQFQSYYSEGIGGFLFMTKDGGDTIKSFTFTGQNGKLRTSVYHYLDDVGATKTDFGYDICIGNLTKGTWYEAADKYRDWATEQSWATEKGKLETRTDIDKTFYEEVALCNFNFPVTASYGLDRQRELYEMTKNGLQGGKLLNVAFGNPNAYTDQLLPLSKENDDYFVFFEFPDFHLVSSANQNVKEWETEVKTFLSDNSSVRYNISGTSYFYECASCKEYTDRFAAKEQSYYDKCQVNGYYHDVGISAVHPRQCFHTAHAHGTRVNVISDYVAQMKQINGIARKNSNGIYGQELIFEQMLPYIDFYQARANSDLLGWMEHDRIRTLIESGAAKKVSLFDYVYGAYGARRLDGFMTADSSVGKGYYYVVTETVLGGGIPEYNYEFFTADEFLSPADYDRARMDYLGYLYRVKQMGNEYLVYGDMVKAPKVGGGTAKYGYTLTRFEGGTRIEGDAVLDNAVVYAYRHNGKVGIFLGNATDRELALKFILDALRDYGIKSGEITLNRLGGKQKLCDIKDGKAKVGVTLAPRETALLEIE